MTRPHARRASARPATPAGQVRSANLADSVLRRRLHAILHLGANAYLMALAAWQRGLQVTFHYEMASHCPRFAHLALAGYRGELFTVSDGRDRHTFFRTMGDRTTRESSAACEFKPHTKAILTKAGVAVAPGVVVAPGKQDEAEAFLAEDPSRRYLLKPVNGTLGRGVLRNLSAAEARHHLKTITQPMLLEAFATGIEYRVYVTAGRVIAALIRRPASVEGDGHHSVRELVARKAAARRCHPVYRDDPITLEDSELAFLAAHGYAPNDVPPLGTRVYLSNVPSQHAGGDMIDGLEQLPSLAAKQAVTATRALGLPNAGLDMIVAEQEHQAAAEGGGAPRCVVLEVNQNPYLRLLSIPMPGVFETAHNRVPESIIDDYFPGSVRRHRFTGASFDFNAICHVLASGTVSNVSLPVLEKHWVHERVVIPAVHVDQALIHQLQQVRLRYGLYLQLLKSETGDVTLDWVGPDARSADLRRVLPAHLRLQRI